MKTVSFEQTQMAQDTQSEREIDSYDPWQSARVFLYHDSTNADGTINQGLLNEIWLQTARRLDIANALSVSTFSSLDETAQQATRDKITEQGDLFDFMMLQRIRSILVGQLQGSGRLIIRAESVDVRPHENLGGWQEMIPNVVDTIARLGLGRQVGLRIERSRIQDSIAVETSTLDAVAAYY